MNSMTLSLQLRPALSTDQHTTVILNLGSTNPFLGEQWRTPDIHWYLMFFWLLEQHLNWCLIKHLGSIKPLVLLCWSKDSWLTHNKDLHRCISYGRNFQESSSSGSWRGAYETGTTELSVFFFISPSPGYPHVSYSHRKEFAACKVLFSATCIHSQLSGDITSVTSNDHFLQLAKFHIYMWKVVREQSWAERSHTNERRGASQRGHKKKTLLLHIDTS